MKKIIIALTLTTTMASFTANAWEVAAGVTVGASLVASTIMDALCNMAGGCKEAIQVVQDAQDFNQTGKLSAFLEQKIQDAKASNQSLSDEEALDEVVATALAQIK